MKEKRPKVVCVKENRVPGQLYGALFELELLKNLSYIRKKNQNFTILCTGETGSGKSSLMLFANLILEGGIDLERIAFDVKTTAVSFSKADELSRNGVKGAFWGIDELKTYSRSSMHGFNKDMIDLFFSVRGKNIFCFANAPSAKAIDKLMIGEKTFDAFIYIYASQARFLWFDFKGFSRLIKQQGDCSHNVITEFGVNYALFDSYFSKVPDSVYDAYNKKKIEGMNRTADAFVQKYSEGKVYGIEAASRRMNKSRVTVGKYIEDAVKQQVIAKVPKIGGSWAFTDEHIAALESWFGNNGHLRGA